MRAELEFLDHAVSGGRVGGLRRSRTGAAAWLLLASLTILGCTSARSSDPGQGKTTDAGRDADGSSALDTSVAPRDGGGPDLVPVGPGAIDSATSTDVPAPSADAGEVEPPDASPVDMAAPVEAGVLPVCAAGTHACAGSCVDNTNIAHCGLTCIPCVAPTGGIATCGGQSCGGTCPTGTKLCAGACIPLAQACAGACPAGSHDCAGTCQPTASANSCGTSCTPCVPPLNATATCDGTACGFTCKAGFHLCGGACVADTSPATCGTSCTACPAPPTATATCNGRTCGFTCPVGTHACAGACVSSSSPASCGASCIACPIPAGGTATCDGMSCGGACPAGTKLCAGACIPLAQACMGVCPAGTHDCSGTCQPNTALASCGAACTPCPGPANATATCNGTACGFTCNVGYHLCGTTCVANISPASCGASCTPCAAPVNGTATCNGTSCGFTCATGFHACGSTCVSNSSVNSCGLLCTACPVVAGGTSTCTGAATCDVTCNTGYLKCEGGSARACQTRTFGFESTTTEGFVLTSGPAGVTATNSALRARTGTRSLAINYAVTAASTSRRAVARVNLCTGAGVANLSGSTMSVWVFIDSMTPLPNPITSGNSDASIYLYTQTASFLPPPTLSGTNPPLGTWFQISAPLGANTTQSLGLALQFYVNGVGDWSGTIYFDDFTITP